MTAQVIHLPSPQRPVRAMPELDDRITSAFQDVYDYGIRLGLNSGYSILAARRTAILIDHGVPVPRATDEGQRYARELWDRGADQPGAR